MNKVNFADSGIQVSEMCLGTMMFGDRCDEKESARILDTAVAHGVTFIDTAAMYGDGYTEEILGRIMQGKRQNLFIGTKVMRGTDPEWIVQSLENSLTRLQTDYVDLYMIHWPHEDMHLEPMMAALNSVVEAGKARFVGCCNFPAWLLAECNRIATQNGGARLICNQIPYNIIERGAEVEVLPQAVATNIAITTYRPILLGILAGKYKPGQPIPEDSRGTTDPRIPIWLKKYADGLQKFNDFAAARYMHPAQLAVAWQRKARGVTSPIVGVSSEGQLAASLAAFEADLTDEEFAEVTEMFDTAVKEESGGAYPSWRQSFKIIQA